jgi:hypothetical protein
MTPIYFAPNELDWLLKRALDRRSEITSNPTSPEVDGQAIAFLTGIIDKIYASLKEGTSSCPSKSTFQK